MDCTKQQQPIISKETHEALFYTVCTPSNIYYGTPLQKCDKTFKSTCALSSMNTLDRKIKNET